MDNIHAVTALPHTIYLVAERSDTTTRQALADLDGEHVSIVGDFGGCPAAMNAGYRLGTGEFAFTGNDDMRFHRGWETAALDALQQPGKHICGTNDGNDRMTCFAMVRRSFIREHSGVFDKPDTLYHEYISQGCDRELAQYAKARGVWTEAPDSLTEHLHWEFGKADRNHPNYRKGQAVCGEDNRVCLERQKQWEAACATS